MNKSQAIKHIKRLLKDSYIIYVNSIKCNLDDLQTLFNRLSSKQEVIQDTVTDHTNKTYNIYTI